MPSVHDVAAYILSKQSPMSAMKLPKLCYYSQAWHLVWDDEELFQERIEAWANGPVIPELYDKHRGQFRVSSWEHGDAEKLNQSQTDSVDAVLESYGDLSAFQLSEMTHREDPWKDARQGTPEGDRSNQRIHPGAIQEYYLGV